ncbi:MAG: hypothetical protein AAFV95_00395 [Bacteroidota bacterium]
MASGFWYLQDGRGYARTVRFMVDLFEEIYNELASMETAREFAAYLSQYLFTDDHEFNGYGGYYHKETGESVMMHIDFREFTAENQALFWQAAQSRLNKLIRCNAPKDEQLIEELKLLLDMNKRAKRGEDPMLLNHMRGIEPPSGERKGPGWLDQNNTSL